LVNLDEKILTASMGKNLEQLHQMQQHEHSNQEQQAEVET